MLTTAIEKKRNTMIYFGMKYGLCDSKTIKCSQDLDRLINFQQKLQQISLTLSSIQAK